MQLFIFTIEANECIACWYVFCQANGIKIYSIYENEVLYPLGRSLHVVGCCL